MYEFYVYVYLDPRAKGSFKYGSLEFEYEPFYIGKGKLLRYLSHLTQTGRCNKINKINSIRKTGLEPIVIKLKENLSEENAFNLEIELIKTIGRKWLKEGPLTNFHEGGKGSNGIGPLNTFYGKHHTEARNKKMSEFRKQWVKDNYEKVKSIARKSNKTILEKIAAGTLDLGTFRGKHHLEKTKQKVRETRKLKNLNSPEKNSQFGSYWITNGVENKKIKDSDIPEGWYKGRKILSKEDRV